MSMSATNTGLSVVKLEQKKRAFWNFEFMDLDSMPKSLRSTLRDLLHVSSNYPFRPYDEWAAQAVYDYAQKHKINEITELGAGCAPITRTLLRKHPNWQARFHVTDIHPDEIAFNELSKLDSRVNCVWEPIDFTKPQKDFNNSLLVLSAAFHHIPEEKKERVLESLRAISPHVLILEPLRPTLSSVLLAGAGLSSGLLAPFFRMNSKKFFRCAFWCWVFPVAPLLFVWDGCVSALRCWSRKQWEDNASATTKEGVFCSQTEFSWHLQD